MYVAFCATIGVFLAFVCGAAKSYFHSIEQRRFLRIQLMKKLFATATACVALLAAPAQAFTTWSNFEIDGYDVTARYHDGDLRYITAVNEETGDTFSARVGYNGVA
ncbi:MAG: hypothetical protein ACFBZ9_05750, partial [Sphingomonadales bacterium]